MTDKQDIGNLIPNSTLIEEVNENNIYLEQTKINKENHTAEAKKKKYSSSASLQFLHKLGKHEPC